jgi:hypothetical protein
MSILASNIVVPDYKDRKCRWNLVADLTKSIDIDLFRSYWKAQPWH